MQFLPVCKPWTSLPRQRHSPSALREGSLDRVRALAAPDFWERAGEADYSERLPVSGTVELLGILSDRSLLLVTPAAGTNGQRYALEQAWSADAPPLLLDERYFSLLDARA